MWIWKPPYEGHRYVISVDNSRGSSDDATALEIIDLDGIDDDGLPCVEQVAEYNGKLTGDIIGEIAYNYGMMYNCAFIVVEDIGGYGSATLLTLQNLKYPNLYYDEAHVSKNIPSDLDIKVKTKPPLDYKKIRQDITLSYFNISYIAIR
jgi:hypothetical protein